MRWRHYPLVFLLGLGGMFFPAGAAPPSLEGPLSLPVRAVPYAAVAEKAPQVEGTYLLYAQDLAKLEEVTSAWPSGLLDPQARVYLLMNQGQPPAGQWLARFETAPGERPRKEIHLYDWQGRLAQQLRNRWDESGREEWLVTRYTYDAEGRLLAVTDPLGRTRRYTYSQGFLDGQITQVVTEELDVSDIVIWDPATQSYSPPQPRRLTWRWEYTAGDLPARKESVAPGPGGRARPDAGGTEARLLSYTDPAGKTTRYLYDEEGRLQRVLYPAAAGEAPEVTEYRYSARGDYKVETRLEGRLDSAGKLTTVATAEERVYDRAGRLVQVSFFTEGNPWPAGKPAIEIRLTYGEHGWVSRQERREADGSVWETNYVYDDQGRLRQALVTGPRGYRNQEDWIYNDADRTVIYIDDQGWRHEYVYDANGRLLSVSKGHVQQRLNPWGEVTAERRRDGETLFTWDGRGRLLTALYPDQTRASWRYDNAGNIKETWARDGKITRYRYDELDRLREVREEDGRTTTYYYDPSGNLAQVCESTGKKAIYVYDSRNRLVHKRVEEDGEIRAAEETSSGRENGEQVFYTYNCGLAPVTVTTVRGEQKWMERMDPVPELDIDVDYSGGIKLKKSGDRRNGFMPLEAVTVKEGF